MTIRLLTVAGFVACLLLIVILDLVARREPQKVTPLASMIDHVMASRSARIGILLFWWWLGWHFLVGQTV
ncbi:MAG: hypothetical protein IT190_03405 [Microbacteriaceae bacterium]|nr:hypothetical protein [Microbacteriaceae bacterium]